MNFRRPFETVTPTLDGDVLAVLAGADAEFTAAQVARMVGDASERGVRNALDRLARQGIVHLNRTTPVKLFALNRDHLAAPWVIGLSGLRAQLLDRLERAVGDWTVKPLAATLFGSVARGEAGPDSDVDVLVVRPARQDPDSGDWPQQVEALRSALTAWTGNDARLLEYGADEIELLTSRRERVVREALRDGIFFHGSAAAVRRNIGPAGG